MKCVPKMTHMSTYQDNLENFQVQSLWEEFKDNEFPSMRTWMKDFRGEELC